MKIIVRVFLKDHCIETGVKKELKKLFDEYMLSDEAVNKEIENKIKLLTEFIDNSNFAALRASDERLAGLCETCVEIFRENGVPVFQITE